MNLECICILREQFINASTFSQSTKLNKTCNFYIFWWLIWHTYVWSSHSIYKFSKESSFNVTFKNLNPLQLNSILGSDSIPTQGVFILNFCHLFSDKYQNCLQHSASLQFLHISSPLKTRGTRESFFSFKVLDICSTHIEDSSFHKHLLN